MAMLSKLTTTIYATALLTISTASDAAILTYTANIFQTAQKSSSTDYFNLQVHEATSTRQFSFANFDTSLGTLDSVEILLENIQINGNHTARFRDSNSGAISGYAEMFADVEFTVDNGSGISFSTPYRNNGRVICDESAVFATEQECDINRSISLSYADIGANRASYAAMFTGPGLTHFSVSTNFDYYVHETDQDDGYVDFYSFVATMNAVASISYSYTPPQNPPPPSNNVSAPALTGLFGLFLVMMFCRRSIHS
jgi:hypothetical protein